MDEHPDLLATPIRDLGLTIAGSRLEPVVEEFLAELEHRRIRRVRPRLYLSTEWGVPDGTVAIAIPFYLARADLTRLNAERTGHVEGRSPKDILRYLRHEMGHVINYAYRLFDTPEWEHLFGSIDLPYHEDYRPEPFSRDFVRHLPGWYAQKHPDEDWAETFAVWMTPGFDWRAQYADWPAALRKLVYCDEVMKRLVDVDPLVNSEELDEDVSEIDLTLGEFYEAYEESTFPTSARVDHLLTTIFEDLGELESPGRLASALIERLQQDLATQTYRWSGHFPERTLPLLRHLADRADALALVYPESHEDAAIVGLTAMVVALAATSMKTGKYEL